MKRFLKKKIVDTNKTAGNLCAKIQQTVEREQPQIQPPLPLYPPPPDIPPPELITVKQEIEDYNSPEDDSSLNMNMLSSNQPPDLSSQAAIPKKAICKDFIRGNCLRTQCKFAHERDLTQLEGIFTFCWNYQNSTCQITHCKYVHASLFEEGEFYRTGKLPPHALDHVRQHDQIPPTRTSAPNVNLLPPPPPPPPPQESQMSMGSRFTNPPPPLYTAMPPNKPSPMGVIPPPMTAEMQPRGMDAFRFPQTMCPPTAPKASIPLTYEFEDQTPECSSCADMEFRLQYNKAKVIEQMQTNIELEEMSNLLDHKIRMLYSVLVTVL